MGGFLKNGEFDSDLLRRVHTGSVKAVRTFMTDEHTDLVDSLGRTLLHHAVEHDNVPMVEHLLQCNYNIDAADNRGHTPLMLAAKYGCVESAKILIEARANVYLRDGEDKNVLLDESGFANHRELRAHVKMILAKVRKDHCHDERLLVSRLRDIDCSLPKAVYLGDANVVRMMLDGGYSVDERELRTHDTALHVAVRTSEYEIVKVLLEYGANVAARNNAGLSPVYLCEEASGSLEERVKVLRILIEHGAVLSRSENPQMNETPAQYILNNGDLPAIETLLQCDPAINPQDILYDLTANPNPDALEAVRGKNFDVNDFGSSPAPVPVLSFAVRKGTFRKVQFFLEHGADVNVADPIGRTPLIHAVLFVLTQRKEYISTIILLLQCGANAQYSFMDGTTVFDGIESSIDLLQPVIAHLAMIESRGESITDPIRSKIDRQDDFKAAFEDCKRQLEYLRNTLLYGNVSLYKLLTESEGKIGRYARNHEFASKFAEKMRAKQLDLYYSITLRKRVGKAIHLVKWRKEAVTALGNMIEYKVDNLEEIVAHLDSKELKNIC